MEVDFDYDRNSNDTNCNEDEEEVKNNDTKVTTNQSQQGFVPWIFIFKSVTPELPSRVTTTKAKTVYKHKSWTITPGSVGVSLGTVSTGVQRPSQYLITNLSYNARYLGTLCIEMTHNDPV